MHARQQVACSSRRHAHTSGVCHTLPATFFAVFWALSPALEPLLATEDWNFWVCTSQMPRLVSRILPPAQQAGNASHARHASIRGDLVQPCRADRRAHPSGDLVCLPRKGVEGVGPALHPAQQVLGVGQTGGAAQVRRGVLRLQSASPLLHQPPTQPQTGHDVTFKHMMHTPAPSRPHLIPWNATAPLLLYDQS